MSPTPPAHWAEEMVGSEQAGDRGIRRPSWKEAQVSPQPDSSAAVRTYYPGLMTMGWSDRSSSVTSRLRVELTVSSGNWPV